MSACINLRDEYGDRFRIGLDEAAGGRSGNPWNFQILCRFGHICPWGGDLLAASTKGSGSVANRLKKLAGVEVIHDGDDGATVVFPQALFKKIAALMKPFIKRRPTAAQAAALAWGRSKRRTT
jgi:hypothetical protein